MEVKPFIQTRTGNYSSRKFNALIDVRKDALSVIRRHLEINGFTEVLTAVLVNIAGSCENPYASFKLPYYGKDVHLSQSAQLQLEKLVVSLDRKVFTVNNSFREENFDDPDAAGRRLSEFTLIEPEMPLADNNDENNLISLTKLVTTIIKEVLRQQLDNNEQLLVQLGADIDHLHLCLEMNFRTVDYHEAIDIIRSLTGKYHSLKDGISVKEEKLLLKHFERLPFFIINFPHDQKLFNIKRRPGSDCTYTFDLIMPQLGEAVGGGLREENPDIILSQLHQSKVGKFLHDHNGQPEEVFEEYFNALQQQANCPRGGFGIGFERLIGFLINSNDILHTISYRSFVPGKPLG